ncbi:Gnk2-like domain containing protein [Trema orientale]|uniref:Gnk2-like domain containing protein n=1 Tax=Trema orientale TaxID=63057 RepID=A0A2P5EAU2_TREOI|nr:Gnk2-like domain containing protein [Trema orientale]
MLCPYKTDMVIWYDYCLLRNNDIGFFGQVDNVNNMFHFTSSASAGEPFPPFDKKTRQLFGRVSLNASRDQNMFASGEIGVDHWRKIYGLAQYTGEFSEIECKNCLDQIIESALNCCSGRREVRIVSGSCYLRYELPFFKYQLFRLKVD